MKMHRAELVHVDTVGVHPRRPRLKRGIGADGTHAANDRPAVDTAFDGG